MGVEFTFFDYVDEDGVNTISAWLDGPGRAARAKLNAWLSHLESTSPGQWKRPIVDTLTGECVGLFEIRASIARQQYRILGFHGTGHREATLALGTIKSGKIVPIEDCWEALSVKEVVEAQTADRRVRHDFTG